VLRPSEQPTGHQWVWLCRKPLRKKRYVHQLVLEAFAGPCPAGQEVRHRNGRADDNRLENLHYGTRSANTLDKVAHGTHPQASKTRCKRGHEFTAENTLPNPYTLPDGTTHIGRLCKACEYARHSTWRDQPNGGMSAAARIVGFAETGTPEWFQMRAGAMTGSRIAAALGLSPWTSPFTLFFQMRGLAPESAEETPVLEWGRRLEAAVVQKFTDAHPNMKIRTRKTVWQNRDRPWQMCSPDALAVYPGTGARRGANAVVEAKTSSVDSEWGEPGTPDVPIWIRCQALWMLDCLGLRYCHIPVLFSGRDYREYLVEYDEADVAILRHGALQFLDQVKRQERPDIDGADATYELLRKFHPEIDGSTVELPTDLVEDLRAAQASAQRANEALMQVRSSIADFMGYAKIAVSPATEGEKGYKVADRRARGEGIPYVQLVDITERPTTIQEAVS